jgi:hypothetical protein
MEVPAVNLKLFRGVTNTSRASLKKGWSGGGVISRGRPPLTSVRQFSLLYTPNLLSIKVITQANIKPVSFESNIASHWVIVATFYPARN